MTLYDDLQISSNASAAEIKQAFQALARKHHPDKGGDVKKFQMVQHAYAVLKDPEKRKRYDETGEEKIPDFAILAREHLAVIIMQLFESQDPARCDLIAIATRTIIDGQAKLPTMIAQAKARIQKFEAGSKRLKRSKRKDHDFLAAVFAKGLQQARAHLEALSSHKAIGDEMLHILKDYSWQTDPQEAFSGIFLETSSSTTRTW